MVRHRKRSEALSQLSISIGRGAFFTLLLAALSVGAIRQSLAEQANELIFKKDITLADLPTGIEKRIPVGMEKSEILETLQRQPALILDGATLTITAPPAGSGRSLLLSRLELRNGARIVTNGVNLEVDTLLFVSDGGEVRSFDQSAQPSAPARDGTNGSTGLNAGSVVLEGVLNRNDILRVTLNGQNGQQGGRGLRGAKGAPGPRGDNGSDHLFDCAHGGGNGGNGAAGGQGGRGGSGGAGGNGGRLILRGELTSQRAQVEFSAPPGTGGPGGEPGDGGPGGPGGGGGSGTTYCRGGSPGQDGPAGTRGEPGEPGPGGKAGEIFAN